MHQGRSWQVAASSVSLYGVNNEVIIFLNHSKTDFVTRLERGQCSTVSDFEGHGHGLHADAFDTLMIKNDTGFFWLDLHDDGTRPIRRGPNLQRANEHGNCNPIFHTCTHKVRKLKLLKK
jgi:hypothetical protein